MVGIMPASSEHFPWDEALYQQLKADNDAELDGFQREEDEAVEKAGDTEIMAARGKRAEFWARVGDKVGCMLVAAKKRLANPSLPRTAPSPPTRTCLKRRASSAPRSTSCSP